MYGFAAGAEVNLTQANGERHFVGGEMPSAAPWLKAMENGGLGEARAKAFLMDRFWVLERSVDIDGADFLVQRKLTNTVQNFTDRDPPRFGIVQVKFIQDGNTSISIHKSYLCDTNGNPHSEFFLLVFTGREDYEKSYLLSSTEILQEFSERVDGERVMLRINGSKLMATSNYEVLQKKRALDRVEHALKNADFMSNRRFLSSSGYFKINLDHIDSDLLVPIANTYGDIRETFFDEKRKLRSTLYDIEEVVDAMQKMLRTTDPEVAQRLYEDVIAQHIGGFGRGSICFSCNFFNDENFFDSVKNHKVRLAKLRELGVQGSYFKLLELFESTVINRLVDPAFDSSTGTICVKVTYDFATLRNVTVEVTVKDVDRQKPYVESSQAGEQIIYYNLNDSLSKQARISEDGEVRTGLLREKFWRFRRPFQTTLDALLFGDDMVAF